ncbi:hypothetical protein V8G54_015342 [Vigna mungo]|uniref:Uncharacterized protein n=1 Tax=Vigna mungo TaxID=3915 RepID=A0AAQ3NK17_VIGMU
MIAFCFFCSSPVIIYSHFFCASSLEFWSQSNIGLVRSIADGSLKSGQNTSSMRKYPEGSCCPALCITWSVEQKILSLSAVNICPPRTNNSWIYPKLKNRYPTG